MTTDQYGLPVGDINYGTGAGWLPLLNQRDQLLAAMDASRGQLGSGLLNTVVDLMRSPTAGPLGLAAYGSFGGGAQNIAQGTGGEGIPNPYGGLMDRLLAGLAGAVMNPGSPFNPDNKGQYNPGAAEVIDPFKAPMMTPEAAAKAPNTAPDLIKAWEAYNPGKTHPDRGMYGLQYGGGVSFGDNMMHALFGAEVPTSTPVPGQPPMPIPTPPSSTPMASPAPASPAAPGSIKGPGMEGGAGGADPFALYGGRALVEAQKKYTDRGGDPERFINTIKNIAYLSNLVKNNEATVAGMPPVPGTPGPDLTSLSPQVIQSLLQQYASRLPNQMKDGGGMTISGQPHYVVDSQGQPVAALTEDGKPERVEGVGGVEVTPLDPLRNALYEARKRAASAMGKSLAEMTGAAEAVDVSGLATGGSLLFPDYPGGGVDTSPLPGSDLIPSFGGPSGDRGSQVGDYFKSVFDKKTGTFTLPDEARDDTVTNDPAGYAKLLGGALSAGNTAVPVDVLQALNAGKAPGQLLSANALQTLAPSQRSNYFALLEQMGLGSREDNEDMVRRGRPDTMI